VLDTVLALFSALVAKDRGSFSELAQKSDLTSTLFRILDTISFENDTIELLATGVNRARFKSAGVSWNSRSTVSSYKSKRRVCPTLLSANETL
jgi:hypothetical protein